MKLSWVVVLNIIIAVLVGVIFLQRCNRPDPPDPEIIRDTTYITLHDTVPGKPEFVAGKTDTLWQHDTAYRPDTSYNGLVLQYKTLGNKFFATNRFQTKFPIGTYGTVTVVDLISQNSLVGSTLISDLDIPEVTNTVPQKPKRQVYVGGGLTGNPTELLNGAHIGGLYKDRKDRIFGLKAGYNTMKVPGIGATPATVGQFNYTISSYWKLNLRRK